MALQDALDEIARLYREHDIPIARDNLHVGIARWDRKNGYCAYDAKLTKQRFNKRVTGLEPREGEHAILANPKIVEDSGVESFYDTVRHEVAHVCSYVADDYKGHGSPWKRWARRLGADDKRRHNKKDQKYSYYFECLNGHFKKGYHRKAGRLKTPSRYVCEECGLNPVAYSVAVPRPDEPGIRRLD